MPNNNSIVIRNCYCQHDYQDKKFGKNKRAKINVQK